MIGVGMMLLGVVLMLLQRGADPDFFKRRSETFDPNADVDSVQAPEGADA